MATPNVGILTTAGKALIDKVNSGQAKISFSKVVFSSMDNSQLSDTQVKELTAIAPQEVVVSSPETTLDTNSGETRIRATGTNENLTDGVYVKTYGVFAKDDIGNEILYGVTVSPNPNYFPAYDGVTPQAVTYSYKTVIQETSNITMTNSKDVYVTQEDLTEAIATIPQPDLSNYVKTTDTSNWQKAKISADDGSPKSFLYAKDGGNITMWIAGRPLGMHTFWCAAGVAGNPVSSSIQGTMSISSVKNGVGYCVSADGDFISIALVDGQVSYSVLANAANVVDRNPDTGTVSKPTDFTNLTVNGGKSVATRDDLKSIEDASWRPIISDNYSGLCVMKYNTDTETMSLSGTIFPKKYSVEGSRVSVIIPLPDGFSMGTNADSKATIWTNVNGTVQNFTGIVSDLKFESDGVHITFDKIYSNKSEPSMFIVLDGFFSSSTSNGSSSSFINFKVTKN